MGGRPLRRFIVPSNQQLGKMSIQGSKHSAPTAVPRRILVFGCGYLGSRVASRAVAAGHEVWATTRDLAKGQSLRGLGIEPIICDWTDRRTLASLPDVECILVAVSHDPRGSASRIDGQVGGFRNLLQAVSPQASISYISTTGVYDQTDGCWVDESSPTNPTRAGARAHLWGESLLHRLRPRSPWTILRLAGIYGPGRIPRVADVRAGRPIASAEHGFLNLIHVDDAADAVLASWTRAAERIYLVADDLPVVRGEYYRFIASRCGAPEPTFVDPGPNASDRLRSESNKRIWNRRMKRDLVHRLRYPTYREGLAELL